MCKIDYNLVSETGTWYETCIEEPIRPLVKLLRDNGFNTECSCGHEMYVQCQYYMGGGILQRLHTLLYNNGYENYEITVYISVFEGHLYQHLNIKLNNRIDESKNNAKKS